MTREDYEAAQHQVLLICALARRIDANGMLQAIDRSETLGPITDPTLYRAGAPRLEIVKRCAQAVAALQAKLPSEKDCLDADKATEALLEFHRKQGGAELAP